MQKSLSKKNATVHSNIENKDKQRLVEKTKTQNLLYKYIKIHLEKENTCKTLTSRHGKPLCLVVYQFL